MKSRTHLLFYFLLLLLCFPLFSDGQDVTIKVKDESKDPLIGATVRLTAFDDSTSKFSATTNVLGFATFNNVGFKIYNVKISYIGYVDIEKTISVQALTRSFEFTMEEKSQSLGVVKITSTKPLIHQEEDKMIIDPKPLVGISSNTLEVLESTPGLFVDYESGIYLTSATPAVIYVNGREQKLSNEDIMTLLRNLPPGSIEKIEVIKTPSSKYDAATSGGIINIVLKKGMKIGRFGNASIGMNQGVYGNRFAGFSINNSGKNSSYYLSANFNRNDFQETLNSLRFFNADTSLTQASLGRQTSNLGYIGYGFGYDFNDDLNFSYDGRISYSKKKSNTGISNIIMDSDLLYLMESENQTTNHFNPRSINQDLGLTRIIDTLGSEWENKFSYSLNLNNSEQDYSSAYIVPINIIDSGNGNNEQQRNFILFQSDLTYQFPHKIKLEAGIKSTWQDFNSKSDYFKISGGTSVSDSSRTNSYDYKESINAAYLQASKTIWGNVLLKAGCRLEQTYMQGNQTVPVNTEFIVNRADFFPYVYLSRDLPKFMGIRLKSYLIYRRTISRPDYQNLNPNKKYVDPFLYESGNPELKPQFTGNIEWNISYDDMPILAIGKNYTKDIFSSVVYSDSINPSVAVMTYDNLGTNNETYFKSMIGIPPGGKYFFAVGAQFNMSDYSGYYEGAPLSYTRGSWRLFSFHSLNLFSQTRITMYGFMMVNGQQGFYELKNFGSLNFGITQTFLHKSLMITLNARDVLHTMVTKFELKQGVIRTTGDRYSDNQRIGINIRYNFGLGKKNDRKGFNNYEDDGDM
jgi:iron complex outermembrane recepter protein